LARTVLLADDSVTAQNMGRRILIDAGYEVITVNNGSAALKKIHESRPDLIVLDVYMPGYGGLEVCQRLKESSETSRIPVLLTVGKMEPFKPEEAKRARADGHIIKPFDASELLAALTKLEDRIVPQAEPPRGRKSKSEKKSRSWQVADPAVSYDDTQTDKIAYLTEVKQKHSGKQHDEPIEAPVDVEASAAASEQEEVQPELAKPRMAMPMSVYAAEQLRELPVIAEPAPVPQEFQPQQEESPAQNSPAEGQSATVAEAPVVEEKSEPATAEAAASEQAAAGDPQSASENIAETSAQVAEVEAAPATIADSDPVEQPSIAETSEPQEPAAEPEQMQAAPPQNAPQPARWVAENVAVTAEEAALELDREMQAQSSVELRERSEADLSLTPADTPAPELEQTNGATFAAAAGAAASSASALSASETEAQAPVVSETAAAWENWQHIRDSVMGSQTAVSLSQSVVEAVQASVSAPPAEAGGGAAGSEQAEMPQAPAELKTAEAPVDHKSTEAPADEDDSAAISNIVDSVLAELKPKLMAEISKKLKK
jgi:CheY-like chemotaxis protein